MPLVPANLTPAEQAEFDKLSPPQQPQQSVLSALSAPELAELATKDKSFDLVNEFKQNKDLWGNPEIVQKVADAHNQLKQRGFQFSDLPGVGEVAKNVVGIGKGLAKQAWNYANAAGAAAAGAIFGGEAENEMDREAQRRVAENFAGTEQAATGLGEMVGKIGHKIGQKAGLAKDWSQFTPQEKVQDLWNDVGAGEVKEDIAKGHGATMGAVGGEVIKDLEQHNLPVRPEENAELAAGDPFSLAAFSGGFKAGEALVPTAVKTAAQRAVGAAGTAAAKVGGRLIEKAADATELGAKAAKIAAPYVAPVVGAVEGGAKGGPIGVLAGLAGGGVANRAIQKGAEAVINVAPKVARFGEEVGGKAPVTSAYSQLAKSALEAAPAVAAKGAEGAAIDLGLAAGSAEKPSDSEGIGTGAALGLGAGLLRGGQHVISGQIISPRGYKSTGATPSNPNFPALSAMNAQAVQSAPPGVVQRLNAIRQFTKGLNGNVDVFYGADPASIESALVQSGVAPDQAKTLSQQNGFTSFQVPDKSGTPRTLIVARDIESAPHESFHAIQDILGESANRQIDEQVKKAYAGQWENLGSDYAKRIDPKSADWRGTVLDASGAGQAEAVDKLYQSEYNRLLHEAGATPTPEQVKPYVVHEWEQAGKDWRNVLSPEEATAAGDRYLARELAAENFDAVFEHGGGTIKTGNQLPEQLARVVGDVVNAFGGNILSGETSKTGTPLNYETTKAVRGLAQESQGKAEPVVRPKGKPSVIPETPTPAPEAPTKPPEGPSGDVESKINEAISNRQGVKLNYLSAPDEPAAAISSNRDVRRQIIEAFRYMPKEARALWEKNFFPEKVVETKGGGKQVQGWSPEVFAANAHKLAAVVADVDPALSPYPIDPDFKTFTPEGWQELYRDVSTFVQNQVGGRTGSGKELAVPEGLGATKPEVSGEAQPLDQNKADFINMLFGFKLPETTRMRAGKMPLNIVGQRVSEATLPGRTEIPVRPRGEYIGKEANALGIAGEPVKEVNPLRNKIEAAASAAGKAMPSMIEAIQKLNMEHINDVTPAPEAPDFRGNSLTLTSGLQPPTDSTKEHIVDAAVRMPTGEVFSGQFHGDAMKKALDAGHLELDTAKDGFVTNTGRFVDRNEAFNLAEQSGQITKEGLQRRGVPAGFNKLESTTFQEARQFQPNSKIYFGEVDEDGVVNGKSVLVKSAPENLHELHGMDAGEGRVNWRAIGDKLFWWSDPSEAQRESVLAHLDKKGVTIKKSVFMSDYDMASKTFQKNYDKMHPRFQPMADRLENLDEAKNFKGGKYGGGPTGWAFEIGAKANPEDLADFKSAYDHFQNLYQGAKSAKDFSKMAEYSLKAQLAHEAYQIATGERLDGRPGGTTEFIQKHYDPNFTPPLAPKKGVDTGKGPEDNGGMNNTALQPKGSMDRELEKVRAGKSFGQTFTTDGKVWQPKGKQDVVTLASTNIPAEDLNRDAVEKALEPYKDILDNPGVVTGVFAFDKDGQKMVSIDLNAVVDQKHRDNSLNFAKNNNQIAIWDAAKGESVQAGGNGETVMNSPEQVAEALPKLLAGEPHEAPSDWELPAKAGSDGIKKAWITPSGQPVQLGATWHHNWLAEHPEYGIKVAGTPDAQQDARVDALKKGFVRINYSQNTGTLTVEARADDWKKQGLAVRQFVESNLPDVDNIQISLFDKGVKKVVDDNFVRLFNYDDADKISHVPLLESGEVRTGGAAPVAEGETLRPDKSYNPNDDYFKSSLQPEDKQYDLPMELPPEGPNFVPRSEIATMTTKQLAERYPEAVIPKDKEEPITSDIKESPLFKKSKTEEKAVDAFADKLVEFARKWENESIYQEGRKWYSEFVPLLKEHYGDNAQLFAELLAATSPQTNVAQNWAMAVDAIEGYKSGRFDAMIKKFNEGIAKVDDGSWNTTGVKNTKLAQEQGKARFMAKWIEDNNLIPLKANGTRYNTQSLNVMRVLARRWLELQKGPKTRNFVANLTGDGHEATIDLWADRTMRRLGYADTQKRWRILPKNGAPVKKGDFDFAQKVFRKAATTLGMQPSELQAAVWFAEKQLWHNNGWSKLDLGDYKKELEKMPKAGDVKVEPLTAKPEQKELNYEKE